MKLSTIRETGHWDVPNINYPNAISKGKKSKRPMSMLLHPEDRERFFGGATMGKNLKEEELDAKSITQDISQLPEDNEDKIKSDSINNKKEKDRQKMLQTRTIAPKINQLQTNIKTMHKTLADKQKQTETDKESYQNLDKNVNSMTKTFDELTRFINK